MTFDGSHLAFGCINLQNVQFANMGPALMTLAFTNYGINVIGGGNYLHHSWSGELYPKESGKENATATNYNFGGAEHDCIIEDIIIFSGLVGVNSTNGANRI